MTLATQAYMTASDFKAQCTRFGVSASDLVQYSDVQIDGWLASATVAINNFTNYPQGFYSPSVEIWIPDAVYRRIRVDFPMVTALQKLEVQSQAGTWVDVPVNAGVGGNVIINNQDNYIELAQSVFNGLTPAMFPNAPVPNSLNLPPVRVTYTTSQQMPPYDVVEACGYIAGVTANTIILQEKIAAGLTSIEIPNEVKIQRTSKANPFAGSAAGTHAGSNSLSDKAIDHLSNVKRVIPGGYRPSQRDKSLSWGRWGRG